MQTAGVPIHRNALRQRLKREATQPERASLGYRALAFVTARGGDPKMRLDAAIRIFEGWVVATYWDAGPWSRGLPEAPRTRQESDRLRGHVSLRKVRSSGYTELRDYLRFRRVMRELDISPPTAQGGRLANWLSDRRAAWREFKNAIERAGAPEPGASAETLAFEFELAELDDEQLGDNLAELRHLLERAERQRACYLPWQVERVCELQWQAERIVNELARRAQGPPLMP